MRSAGAVRLACLPGAGHEGFGGHNRRVPSAARCRWYPAGESTPRPTLSRNPGVGLAPAGSPGRPLLVVSGLEIRLCPDSSRAPLAGPPAAGPGFGPDHEIRRTGQSFFPGRTRIRGRKTVAGSRLAAPHLGHIVPLKNPLNVRHGHVANNTFTNCAACNNRQGNAVVIDGHQNHDDPRESYLRHIVAWGYPFPQN